MKEDNHNITEPAKLNYFKGDYDRFRDLCKNTDWNTLLHKDGIKDTDEMLQRFYSTVSDYEKMSVPTYPPGKEKHRKPPWLTTASQKAIKKKYHCWKR